MGHNAACHAIVGSFLVIPETELVNVLLAYTDLIVSKVADPEDTAKTARNDANAITGPVATKKLESALVRVV